MKYQFFLINGNSEQLTGLKVLLFVTAVHNI